jgi:UDP-glucose 4-epimerase
MEKNNGTILITGVLGFIPSSLAKGLLDKGFTVIGIDNFLTGSVQNISEFRDNPRFKFVRGDVNIFDNIYKLFYSFNPDYVYHYAACVGVQRTLDNPRKVLDDVKGFENILTLCKDFNVKRVFFSSSSEVYGEPVEFPQNENTTPLNSKLPYAVVKNLGEVYLKTYYKEYGLEYTIFRFFNTYGPRQSQDFVVSRFINFARQNQPITIYGDGMQTRTFCYIDDNVRATISALTLDKAACQIYNVGSDKEVPIIDLAKLVIKLTSSKSEIKFLPALEEGDMTRRHPNNQRMLAELLNGKVLVPLEEGLRNTIAYHDASNRS